MSNYTKQISWSGKDALSDSDPEKVISGGDFDTEFSAVQTAINSKIDDIVDDTTPQLGGDLDFQTHKATSFTSTGIDDNATSTAITIDASENVGIGVTAPDATLETSNNTTTYSAHFGSTLNATGDNVLAITAYDENPANTSYLIRCTTNTGVAGAGNNRFSVLADGRGLSEFTAKAWVNFNGTGTIAIRDSHNVSSITDDGVGFVFVNFANNLGSANYSITGGFGDSIFARFDSISTSTYRGISTNRGGTEVDTPIIMHQVFGD